MFGQIFVKTYGRYPSNAEGDRASPPNPLNGSTHLSYADDHTQLNLLAFKAPNSQATKTGRAIEERNQYEIDNKISNHMDKMHVVAVAKTKPKRLVVDGQRMEYKQEAKWLGLQMTYRSIVMQVHTNKGKAGRNLTKLKRFTGLTPSLKLRLYKSLIMPMLTYPAVALVTCSRSAQLSLQVVQSRALRWAVSDGPLDRRPRNQDLHERFKLEPLNIRIHRLAKNTWERLERNEDPNLARIHAIEQALGARQEHTWWPRSRPRALGPPPAPLLVLADVRN